MKSYINKTIYILLFIIFISCLFSCNSGNNTIVIDESMYHKDFSDTQNAQLFENTCFFALEQFEYLYTTRKIDIPDFTSSNISLRYFYVETDVDTSNIAYITFKFALNHKNMTYLQSVNIRNGRVTSYINSGSPTSNNNHVNEDSISLYELISKIDRVDFSYFINLKSNADKYGFRYSYVSDIFHKNTGNVKRYLINSNDEIIEGDNDNDIKLDDLIPVIDFIGYVETQLHRFEDNEGLSIYLNN